jgi:hypothetical protein
VATRQSAGYADWLERSRHVRHMTNAVGRLELEVPLDERHVRVVVVVEPKSQLQTTRANDFTERFQTWLDSPALPAGDLGLGAADEIRKLRLGEAGTATGFSKQIGANHFVILTLTDLL